MSSLNVSTVICPQCHAEVDAHAIACTRCGASLISSPTAPAPDAIEPDRIIDRPWLIVLAVLHVGVLGIPLYLSTKYSLTTRLLICLVSMAYTVFAVAAIVWGIMHIWRSLSSL